MRAPKAPATPDPYAVAASQQLANVEVAKANTWLSNINEVRPDGSLTYTVEPGDTVDVYTYDDVGDIKTTQAIPRLTRTVTLSTAGQTAFEQQEDITVAFNEWALAQVGILSDQQGDPLTLVGLTNRLPVPTTPATDTQAVAYDALTMSIGSADLVAHMDGVADAINERIQYQIDLDRAARITALAHQGIVPGMAAFEAEMFAFDKQSTDARIQAFLASRQEQSRIVALEEHVAAFRNDAVVKKFGMDNEVIDRTNERRKLTYQLQRDLAEYVSQLRQHELQERMSVRTTNINEITALLHGGQVTVPQFQPFSAGKISDTPVASSVYQSAAMDMNKWQQRIERQNQIISGVASLIGNVGSGMAMGALPMPGAM